MRYVIALLLILSLCAWGTPGWLTVEQQSVGGGTSFDYFDETFEGVGSLELWTEATGTADFDYTTNPISGSQSGALDDGIAVANSLTAPLTSPATEVYCSLAFSATNISTYPSDRFVSFLDASDNVIAEFRLFSSMTQIYTYYLDTTVQVGAAESYTTSGGETVYLGLHYTAGAADAVYEFWISSTPLGENWGAADQTYTANASAAGIAKIKLYRDAASAIIFKYDDITATSTQVAY